MLDLDNTAVSDLTPLSGLGGLTRLRLTNTGVTDLTPLSGLGGLTMLELNNTAVNDLTPLSGLGGLKRLWLNDCAAVDFRPLRALTRLVKDPGVFGLRFDGSGAAQADGRIAEIAGIEDDAERARSLFAYLEGWVPPPVEAPQTSPRPPAPGIAPLQAEVIEGRLVRVGGHGLPERDAMARAEQGWRALKSFREVFGKSCNTHNYGQLVAVLDGFDAAMGESFDPDRLILIGTMGQGIVALSDDGEFCDMLPTGAAPLLTQFGVQIEMFVNRFPDWVQYQQDARGVQLTVQAVAEEQAAFEEIETALRESEDTDRDVVEDYALQVRNGTEPSSDAAVAKGLVDSTRETTRALAEAAIDGVRTGEIARDELDALDKVHETELAKVKWYAGGFAVVILRRRSGPLRRLARKFPVQLGWLDRVLDYLGAKPLQ